MRETATGADGASSPRSPAEADEADEAARRRAEAVFDEVADLPLEERAQALAAHCGNDERLRLDVNALLIYYDNASDASSDGLDFVHPKLASATRKALADAQRGRQIGPYRVLRELGRGGMGVVYLAERNDGQFHRRVAVKLLQASTDADELYRRFLAERQILACLSHPNIAALLDGGVADGQLPYLVIEYIDGTPLTQYADRHRLGIAARLALFQSVCAAVHHAHQNLVLHRDLKPSNIMVTANGVVKLLDFGIAKLLNPSLAAGDGPITRTAFRVMTPAYASPEQVRGDPLSTTSDVYSLGLILYELLTGQQAHDLTGDAPAEVLKVICERESVRPSERARSTGDHDTTGIAAARGLTPDRLQRQLRGDLDAIVAMALRKEPSRRYGSAELLSADIARYREGLPVLAHRGSRWYRTQKLLYRYRAVVVASAAAAVALVGGTSFSVWQWQQSQRERMRAESALAESQEITTFLLGLFEGSDPDGPTGAAITARELLDRGAARADALAEQAGVQARLLGVLSRVHLSLGEVERATEFGERMLRVRSAEHGQRHPALVAPLTLLADVERRRGAFDSAAALLHRADRLAAAAPAHTDVETGATQHALAMVEVQRGALLAAETHARTAFAQRKAALGDDHPRTVESLALVAAVLQERGEFAAAETLWREAIQRGEAHIRSAPDAAAEDVLQLATLLARDSARASEAEALFARVRAMEAARAQPNIPRTVIALGGLARLMEQRGALAEAESALREIVVLQEQVYGAQHRRVSGALAHLSGLLRRAGRLEAAESILRRMAEIDRATIGPTHPNYAGTITVLATLLTERGAYREADALLREAVAVRESALGPRHPLVAKTLRRQAELRIREGAFNEAERLLQRAVAITLEQKTTSSDDAHEMYTTFATLYDAWSRPAQAQHYRALLANAPPSVSTTATAPQ